MKKLKLNLSNVEGVEVLTREQLKSIMGGEAPVEGGGCSCGSSCVSGTVTDPSTGDVENLYGTCQGLNDHPELGCICV
ncbi:MAG: hypothetical protein QM640_07235 [Niabella sp.]